MPTAAKPLPAHRLRQHPPAIWLCLYNDPLLIIPHSALPRSSRHLALFHTPVASIRNPKSAIASLALFRTPGPVPQVARSCGLHCSPEPLSFPALALFHTVSPVRSDAARRSLSLGVHRTPSFLTQRHEDTKATHDSVLCDSVALCEYSLVGRPCPPPSSYFKHQTSHFSPHTSPPTQN